MYKTSSERWSLCKAWCKKKLCSRKECANYAKNGGVCIRHGAKVKRCSSKGCTNHAKIGGVCKKHGAKVKLCRCRFEGCSSEA
ncbi:hypothetical protein QTG54_016068, partial [Skeletonema marinoi]